MANALRKFNATAASPLRGVEPFESGAVSFKEIPLTGKLTLRGNADDPAFADAAAEILGAGLPTEPLTSVTTDDLTVFWIAFDEWMIWTPRDMQLSLMSQLHTALSDTHHAVVDISDYYTVLRVSGPRSRDLLAKGCHLDLHPRAFKPGQGAGTVFAHATIFVTLVDAETDTFDVMIRWSFAPYLWDYFLDGAREWTSE